MIDQKYICDCGQEYDSVDLVIACQAREHAGSAILEAQQANADLTDPEDRAQADADLRRVLATTLADKLSHLPQEEFEAKIKSLVDVDVQIEGAHGMPPQSTAGAYMLQAVAERCEELAADIESGNADTQEVLAALRETARRIGSTQHLLLNTLWEAGVQFRRYEIEHGRKGNTEKMKVNRKFANKCIAAICGVKPEETA